MRRKLAKAARKSSGRMASKGFPNPIDVAIGEKIRERRHVVGMSQTSLAELMGLTFQQVQKYEKGSNRVAASRIIDLARVLQVEPGWFFDALPAAVINASPGMIAGGKPPAYVPEKGISRFDMDTARHMQALPQDLRNQIGKLVRGLVKVLAGKTGAIFALVGVGLAAAALSGSVCLACLGFGHVHSHHHVTVAHAESGKHPVVG